MVDKVTFEYTLLSPVPVKKTNKQFNKKRGTSLSLRDIFKVIGITKSLRTRWYTFVYLYISTSTPVYTKKDTFFMAWHLAMIIVSPDLKCTHKKRPVFPYFFGAVSKPSSCSFSCVLFRFSNSASSRCRRSSCSLRSFSRCSIC